ncbi:pyridoxamine 5'-phosphate oxidase [Gordoniibacillus kamchatkensis]|uniref:Pyridoxamine 5'-phosphate oxidase n=1 Tax=Gordoniibacillus kamchatkensis TaxID=1590651 RepID=A0ABR5A9R7_9BACL|nr:pyridoxamine 5'-phosphate oxidase family protein [Paenibacillus sp. VKM B-2647]KIL37800.1 pyridoxamine 5'-phosphate oxidase [Paenibacillus sp. VKM B-2647]
MGKIFPAIMPEHEAFIRKQRLFFVGTAPLAESGHVNISPKGYDTFRILSPNEVAYLDVTGSGNETSAHVAENARITIMFVAFEGPPQVLRLFGTGTVVMPGTPRWDELIGQFELIPGARQIICAGVTEVKTSCGYSVPFFDYAGERDTLRKWAINKGEQGLTDYWQQKNAVSMDGIVTPLGSRLSE